MKPTKARRLRDHGWRLGTAADFLGLSAEEAALVECKVALSRALRARRTKSGLSQVQLA